MRDCGTSLQPKKEKKLVEDFRTRFAIEKKCFFLNSLFNVDLK